MDCPLVKKRELATARVGLVTGSNGAGSPRKRSPAGTYGMAAADRSGDSPNGMAAATGRAVSAISGRAG